MKLITIDKRGRININHFKEYIDVKQVKTCQITELGEGKLKLEFFNQNGQKVGIKTCLKNQTK